MAGIYWWRMVYMLGVNVNAHEARETGGCSRAARTAVAVGTVETETALNTHEKC